MAPPAVFCSSEGPASCASPQSTGSAPERAKAALGRIGPCVFNAIVSTFLAVVVIAFSKSFVFVTFFKAFFLVTVRAAAVSRGPPSAWAGPAVPPPPPPNHKTTKKASETGGAGCALVAGGGGGPRAVAAPLPARHGGRQQPRRGPRGRPATADRRRRSDQGHLIRVSSIIYFMTAGRRDTDFFSGQPIVRACGGSYSAAVV
jgi:hypothetical protein